MTQSPILMHYPDSKIYPWIQDKQLLEYLLSQVAHNLLQVLQNYPSKSSPYWPAGHVLTHYPALKNSGLVHSII